MTISKQIWGDPHLSLGEKIVYVEICSYPYGSVDNVSFLNKNLRWNEMKITEALRKLKAKKIIREIPTSHGIRLVPWDYYLTPETIQALIKIEEEVKEREESRK